MAAGARDGGGWRHVPWRAMGWTMAGLVLLLPLGAMQVSDEVAWTASDLVFAAMLLGGVGLGAELAVRNSRDLAYRAAAGLALAAALLTIWINLAVGIIGSEDNPANLLFFAVVLLALAGSAIAGLRPARMAWAMAAAALAQALVPAVVTLAGPGSDVPVWTPEVLLLTGGLAAMWAGAALLFAKAARASR